MSFGLLCEANIFNLKSQPPGHRYRIRMERNLSSMVSTDHCSPGTSPLTPAAPTTGAPKRLRIFKNRMLSDTFFLTNISPPGVLPLKCRHQSHRPRLDCEFTGTEATSSRCSAFPPTFARGEHSHVTMRRSVLCAWRMLGTEDKRDHCILSGHVPGHLCAVMVLGAASRR